MIDSYLKRQKSNNKKISLLNHHVVNIHILQAQRSPDTSNNKIL